MIDNLLKNKIIIGMVHLLPLPGTQNFGGDIKKIEERAMYDAEKLVEGGIDALIIENFGDEPLATKINLHAYTVMANITQKIKDKFNIPLGVNIQFNCYKEEWALAYSLGAEFIRVETFVEKRFGKFGESGPCAKQLHKLKKEFPAKTMIFADVNSKNSKGLPEVTKIEATFDAITEKADAIILTGSETGVNPSIDDIIEIRQIFGNFPILVGSGITLNNVKEFLKYADGIIVGSYFKRDGNVNNEIDIERVKSLVKLTRNH
ncbi:MAG: BtpA/SgcQ family protein [Erysipelotrichaceae bacterium]|jgi:membrane complex biogenesis BtpA family protein